MYKGYHLSADLSDFNFIKQHDCDIFYKDMNNKIINSIKNFYFQSKDFNDFIIDGTKLQNFCFPLSNQHVFISHSHNDIDLVKKISYMLKIILKIDIFVDSFIWSYANDLLHIIDDEYCYRPKIEAYDYNARNFSTSHVHMMLNNALHSMIDNCECLLFLNTKNSINEHFKDPKTSSPWIMSEIYFSSVVRRKPNRFILGYESLAQDKAITATTEEQNLNILYSMNLKHLIDIDSNNFIDWVIKSEKNKEYGYEALNRLYKNYL